DESPTAGTASIDGAATGGSDILFLRPFLVDSRITTRNPRRDSAWAFFIPLYDHMLPAAASIDDAIRLYLKRYGKLVAIGAAGAAVGASRVRVGDDQWQSYFEILAKGARLIIVLCGHRAGTMWEMEQISRDDLLIEKTVFILMPAKEEWD